MRRGRAPQLAPAGGTSAGLSDWLFTRMLMLPMNMSLSEDDVNYVCDHIRAFYGYAS